MPAFLTDLRVRRQPITCRWVLLQEFIYQSDVLGREIVVPSGFDTDLESIPRWLPAAYAFLRETAAEAGVVHDYLYRDGAILSPPVTRAQADAVLYEAARLGAGRIRSWLFWLGVRVGGRSSYRH